MYTYTCISVELRSIKKQWKTREIIDLLNMIFIIYEISNILQSTTDFLILDEVETNMVSVTECRESCDSIFSSQPV